TRIARRAVIAIRSPPAPLGEGGARGGAGAPSHIMNVPAARSSIRKNTAAAMNQFQCPSPINQVVMSEFVFIMTALRQPETPVVGTVGRRGGGALPSPLLGSPPNVALAISPIPASEPSTLVASIGRISTF